MKIDEPPSEYLSTTEVDQALQGLSAADWLRAKSECRWISGNLPGFSGNDLLQEACVRLLAGGRHWKRGIPAVITLKNVMRSIASDTRESVKDGPMDVYAVVDQGAGTEDDDDSTVGVCAVELQTPDRVADANAQLAALQEAVKDDDDAQLLLMAWAEGLYGKEAAEELGFDMKRMDATRKRLERRIAALAEERNTE